MSGIIPVMPGLITPITNYTVVTPVYEGPLDLLLQLIERAELDITSLALAQVTDQYLEHLRNISDSSPDEVSAFLVIAARLLQIKSEALLPRPPQREPGEEDPGEALARQLIIYKRFKELANLLAQRESNHYRTFLRQAPPPQLDLGVDLSGLTLDDLLAAAHWIFSQEGVISELSSVVPPPRVTIREKIGLIADFLRSYHTGTFDQLLSDRRYRLDVVVTFLALLELVKRRMVLARQEALFGLIAFEPAEAWDEDTSFELEFGE
jgi:segregation and condensation protein A